jgi:hypothetical protein
LKVVVAKDGTVIQSRGEDTKARSFFEAISMIEQISAAEMEMDLPEGSYPTFSKLSFSAVAMKHAISTTLLTFLMAPFSMLVLERFLPVFGNSEPGFFDKAFAVLLAAAPAVCLSFFFVYVINRVYIRGKVTRALLGYYVNSYIIVKFIATFFMFMSVFVLYNSVMSLDNIEAASSGIDKVVSPFSKGQVIHVRIHTFLLTFRYVLIQSAVFSTFVHVGCVVVIGLGYLRSFRISRLIDALRREWE